MLLARSDGIQLGLDGAGLVPGLGEIADGINAIIYFARGDKANGLLSLAAMVPIGGQAATAVKLANKALKAGKEGGNLVDDVAKQAKSWLDKDFKTITNKAGDNIFISKDGLRKIRFDIKNPHGDSPHIHLEESINGKWRDAIPGTHRIYPQP